MNWTEPVQSLSALATAMFTLGLLILTVSYVWATAETRDLTHKNLLYTHNPNVFVSNITSHIEPQFENNRLSIVTTVAIKNIGRVEARDLTIAYDYEKEGVENAIEPQDLKGLILYPDSVRSFQSRFAVELSTEDMGKIKSALAAGQKLKIDSKGYTARFGETPLFLTIQISYRDLEGNMIEPRLFKFKYSPQTNTWVIPTSEE